MIITERGDVELNSKIVTVRLPAEILARVDAAGGNRSAIIIQALDRFLPKARTREMRGNNEGDLSGEKALRNGGCPECGAVGGVHQRNCKRK